MRHNHRIRIHDSLHGDPGDSRYKVSGEQEQDDEHEDDDGGGTATASDNPSESPSEHPTASDAPSSNRSG